MTLIYRDNKLATSLGFLIQMRPVLVMFAFKELQQWLQQQHFSSPTRQGGYIHLLYAVYV